MGMIKPDEGEFVRICVELYGTEELTDQQYLEWKKFLYDVAKKFPKLRITTKRGERIIIGKARRKKRG